MRARVHRGDRRNETTSEMILHSLWSTDWMSLGLITLFTLLDIIFITQVRSSLGILQVNILTGIAIVAFCVWYDQTGSRVALVLRSFYILPVGYMMYSQVANYVPLLNPMNFDPVLAGWDRAIFGTNPTHWIYRFSHPILTEYFQLWYNFFQLLLCVPAVSLYRQKRMPEFRIYAMTLLFGFYFSYLLYFAMPAIGPRFEVHNFDTISQELPGLVLTEPLRAIINAGNNIPSQMGNPYDFVNRDCMPSGHTMMSILGILMVWRLRTKWRKLLTVGGISIVISTVYLRYHYVVDLMAGLLLAVLVYLAHEKIAEWWTRRNVPV